MNELKLDSEGFIIDKVQAMDWILVNSLKDEDVHEKKLYYKQGGLYCDTVGMISLSHISRLRVRFGNVHNFRISYANELYTLVGSPNSCNHYSIEDDTSLITLEGLPQTVRNMEIERGVFVTLGYLCKQIPNTPNYGGLLLSPDVDRYVNWLPSSPNPFKSLKWLERVDTNFYNMVYEDVIKYWMENNLDPALIGGISDDVRKIANVALDINHRM